MSSITAITLNALGNDQARIERVATNLANAQTPGYKRELWVERSSAPASGFAQAMAAVPLGAEGGEGLAEMMSPAFAPSTSALVRDMRPATLRPTGRALDLALTGAGLFEVATEQGPAYTRRGELQVDASGRLVTLQGHAVVGQGGEITVGSGALRIDALRIDADGRVFEADRPVAQLRVVEAQPEQLRALGGGLYAADGAVRELPAGQAMVRQGFLENTNVDTAHEMVSLTSNVRHFEAMLRVAQGRDEMLGIAIRKLGEV
jgi:flagellar basal-body rod protein FlgF